jgi:hypothetical protein
MAIDLWEVGKSDTHTTKWALREGYQFAVVTFLSPVSSSTLVVMWTNLDGASCL